MLDLFVRCVATLVVSLNVSLGGWMLCIALVNAGLARLAYVAAIVTAAAVVAGRHLCIP